MLTVTGGATADADNGWPYMSKAMHCVECRFTLLIDMHCWFSPALCSMTEAGMGLYLQYAWSQTLPQTAMISLTAAEQESRSSSEALWFAVDIGPGCLLQLF